MVAAPALDPPFELEELEPDDESDDVEDPVELDDSLDPDEPFELDDSEDEELDELVDFERLSVL